MLNAGALCLQIDKNTRLQSCNKNSDNSIGTGKFIMAVKKKTNSKKKSTRKKNYTNNKSTDTELKKSSPEKTAVNTKTKKTAKKKTKTIVNKNSAQHKAVDLDPFLLTFPPSPNKTENWIDQAFRKRRAHKSLSLEDNGKEVFVAGWALRWRDQGGCVFIDLRDRTEIIQLMFDKSVIKEQFATAEHIRSEYVLVVGGKIRKRSKENINPKLFNGKIELLVEKFSIMSKAATPPISVDEYQEAGEDIRLKYRYLDLRRAEMRDALVKRSQMNMAIRKFLEKEGFIEIETPVLNKSTPEGARDFLVPSRMNPGQFFALPQSPQLFKQILMMGGMEKYFQIVKCFRDEDLRADRQPEFTQLDLELSFVNEDLVMETMERLWSFVINEVFDVQWQTPLPRLKYNDAMELYGKDAPDLRFEMKLVDVADIAKESQFQVFKQIISGGGRVKALPVPGGAVLSRKDIDDLTNWVSRDFGAKGLAWMKHEADGLKSVVSKFFSVQQLKDIAEICHTKPGDILFFGAGRQDIVHATLGNLRERLAEKLGHIPQNTWAPVWITDFPLFEPDPKTGDLFSTHHPFTSPTRSAEDKLDELISNKKTTEFLGARAYDLVLNGNEIGGGSIRIHDEKIQNKVFKILGINEQEAREKFGFFLDALGYGTPPHGGVAFGLDRIMMIFLNRDSIRDVIAFPKTQKGQCLLSESPCEVDPAQLTELRLNLKKEIASQP